MDPSDCELFDVTFISDVSNKYFELSTRKDININELTQIINSAFGRNDMKNTILIDDEFAYDFYQAMQQLKYTDNWKNVDRALKHAYKCAIIINQKQTKNIVSTEICSNKMNLQPRTFFENLFIQNVTNKYMEYKEKKEKKGKEIKDNNKKNLDMIVTIILSFIVVDIDKNKFKGIIIDDVFVHNFLQEMNSNENVDKISERAVDKALEYAYECATTTNALFYKRLSNINKDSFHDAEYYKKDSQVVNEHVDDSSICNEIIDVTETETDNINNSTNQNLLKIGLVALTCYGVYNCLCK